MLLLTLASSTSADETTALRTVLVLFEETRLLPAVAETDDAIRAALQAGSATPIRLYTEYLGLSWFPERERELALRDLLLKTYAARRPDVVIVWAPGHSCSCSSTARRCSTASRSCSAPSIPPSCLPLTLHRR